MSDSPAGREHRLIGIGRCAKGLKYTFQPGQSVSIGRHSNCTIILDKKPQEAGDFQYLSRRHAVIEQDSDGAWRIRDNNSSNGTAVFRRGLPPAVKVSAAGEMLRDKDVIEFAECDHFNLEYQVVAASQEQRDSQVEGHTQRIIAADRPCLQLIHKGVAAQVLELDTRRIVLGSPTERAANDQQRLAIPGISRERIAEVQLEGKQIVITSLDRSLLLNLTPVVPDSRTILKDGDLLTIAGVDETSILFLDPRFTPTRNLSDLLADADRITIGTAADNLIRLIHPSLSRNHAVIWREGGDLFIRDLRSTNGTTVNGQRILDKTRLTQGSTFSLGRLPFVADANSWTTSAAAPSSVDVRFIDVSVEIAGKLRLRKVSLAAGQGETVGLLGPSASGKSTLLRALAGRYRIKEGEIYINGRPMTQNQSRWNWLASMMGFRDEDYEVGFVEQIDLVQPGLTVREVLQYAARQMGKSIEDSGHAAEDVAQRCNLGPLMDRVAQQANGQLTVSGGQLKRICVALELLRQPKILVLDEPTTGQDPKNTDALMQLFHSLAKKNGVTVLLSTHDLRNIEYFDKVAVLCVGYLVYYGPPRPLAAHFNAKTPEAVYASLPDKEDLIEQAKELEARFKASANYKQYCQAAE
jgi:ABC-type multidrug transport system ATPase subunit/pSer/pThr/pTyr-binding forkhead associated (FHA) protein